MAVVLVLTAWTSASAAVIIPKQAPPAPKPTVFQQAYGLIERSNLLGAVRASRASADETVRDTIAWVAYRHPNSKASFESLAVFAERHPDWPTLGRIRINAEQALEKETIRARRLVSFFGRFPALTRAGKVAHLKALQELGRFPQVVLMARQVWGETDFTAAAQRSFLKDFSAALRPEDHAARLDRLVWDAEGRQVSRMAKLVPGRLNRLAEARLALRRSSGNVDRLISKVPDDLQGHPGLVFERARWRRLKGRDEAARAVLWEHPEAGHADTRFWRERRYHVRGALQDGAISQAYVIAQAHGFERGLPFAEGEFLAGWVALRFLAEPERALGHFTRLYEGVGSAISLSRAAYWAGRAADAIGDGDAATGWYGKAASYRFAFYGQLARAALAEAPPPPPQIRVTPEDVAALAKHPMARAAEHLLSVNADDEAAQFLRALEKVTERPVEKVALVRLTRSMRMKPLSIALARAAAADGVVSRPDAFPVLRGVGPGKPEAALVHGIIRQESLFDVGAVSRAGALGLMQLLPGTAKQQARILGVKFSQPDLTVDGSYNVQLGRGYLQGLIDRYDGFYPMAIAAYNAGPGRVDRWIREFGDPRHAEVDVIDWIEMIPFSETRNYVQRVLEGLTMYRGLFNDDTPTPIDARQAKGFWCLEGCRVLWAHGEAAMR